MRKNNYRSFIEAYNFIDENHEVLSEESKKSLEDFTRYIDKSRKPKLVFYVKSEGKIIKRELISLFESQVEALYTIYIAELISLFILSVEDRIESEAIEQSKIRTINEWNNRLRWKVKIINLLKFLGRKK